MKQQINEIKRMQQLAGLIKENKEYTPPIYDLINDLMDEVYQRTGVLGRIVPYGSIKWLPAVFPEDQNNDCLLYKKGNQEVAAGLDFDYGMGDDNVERSVWQLSANDPELDQEFEHDLSFQEVEDKIIDWLKS
jgi:hypothetical protein